MHDMSTPLSIFRTRPPPFFVYFLHGCSVFSCAGDPPPPAPAPPPPGVFYPRGQGVFQFSPIVRSTWPGECVFLFIYMSHFVLAFFILPFFDDTAGPAGGAIPADVDADDRE